MSRWKAITVQPPRLFLRPKSCGSADKPVRADASPFGPSPVRKVGFMLRRVIPTWTGQLGLGLGLSVFVLCGTGHLAAEDPPSEGPREAERLVQQLGAPSYRQRDAASRALANLGPDARTALLRAVESDDPEIELRARVLLRLLHVSEIWMPSWVDCRASDQQVSEVFRKLAAQSGNRLLTGDAFSSFREAPVSVGLGSTEFWRAVDELCRLTGNHVRATYDPHRPGTVIVAGSPGQFPLAYAGPLRAKVTSARRTFNEELDLKTGDSNTTHTFQLSFQVMWEDRFALVAYRPDLELLEAHTNVGQALAATEPPGDGWRIVSPGTRQLNLKLALDPPEGNSTHLEVLRLQLGLAAVGHMQTVVIDDLASDSPHRYGGTQIVVEKVRQKGPRWEITVVVSNENGLPDPQEIVFYENKFEAYDASGRPLSFRSQSHSLTDEGARLALSFAADGAGEPAILHFSFPRIRSQRNVEFVFHDVPLPTNRIR